VQRRRGRKEDEDRPSQILALYVVSYRQSVGTPNWWSTNNSSQVQGFRVWVSTVIKYTKESTCQMKTAAVHQGFNVNRKGVERLYTINDLLSPAVLSSLQVKGSTRVTYQNTHLLCLFLTDLQ